MTPESIRDLLASAVKRAQAEADIRRYELEEYERANGFRSRPADKIITGLHEAVAVARGEASPERVTRLDASRAYREVTGRDAFAGAETYTRRSAEDIHD